MLSRLTGNKEEAAARLAEAYKAARDSAKLDEIESLATVAKDAEKFAKGLGAYIEAGYAPGLELGRSGLSSGSIAATCIIVRRWNAPTGAGVPLELKVVRGMKGSIERLACPEGGA